MAKAPKKNAVSQRNRHRSSTSDNIRPSTSQPAVNMSQRKSGKHLDRKPSEERLGTTAKSSTKRRKHLGSSKVSQGVRRSPPRTPDDASTSINQSRRFFHNSKRLTVVNSPAEKMAKNKSRRSRLDSSLSFSQRKNVRRRDSHGKDKEVKVSASMLRKWKPLPKGTLNFVLKTIDNSINDVLHGTHRRNVEDVLENLTTLKVRLKRKLSTLEVPMNRFGDYDHLNKNMMAFEKSLSNNTARLEKIEEEIERSERLISKTEEECALVQEANSNSTKSSEDERIQHLLQNTQLNFPALTPTSVSSYERRKDEDVIEKLQDFMQSLESIS